jgi:hypothetical protein
MWPFRRKAKPLGAAVTSIPSLVRTVPAPSYVEPAAVYQPPVLPEPTPSPRVELGFRDGSTAALAPGSDQAKALTEIADLLTSKD